MYSDPVYGVRENTFKLAAVISGYVEKFSQYFDEKIVFGVCSSEPKAAHEFGNGLVSLCLT